MTTKFTKFFIPKIKKVYPSLIASKLVGVQPMSQPASLIYYMKYKYTNAKPQIEIFNNGYARIVDVVDTDSIIIDADLQTPGCECVMITIMEEMYVIDTTMDAPPTRKILVTFEDGLVKTGYHDRSYQSHKFKIIWI